MNAGVVVHDKNHTDYYTFDHKRQEWVKAKCILGGNWDRCTAPSSLPKGTKFSSYRQIDD